MNRLRLVGAAAAAVAVRPDLWLIALVQARRFAPDRWWSRPPFLPIPDRELVRFRATTQYGDPDRVPTAEDLVIWLRWCRAEACRRPR
jgi:hypothetical protein